MNKKLFASTRGPQMAPTDTTNRAGGDAYKMEPKHALAQLVMTSCFGDTYYTSADQQLADILKFARECDSTFVAKAAVAAREDGFLKDSPILPLCILLERKEKDLFTKAFARVIDNARMLKGFVAILRSGVTGRKSLGSTARKAVRRWLQNASPNQLFRGSVGKKPVSLVDVLKLAHPKPESPEKEALYGYLIGRDFNPEALPPLVRQYEQFKASRLEPGGPALEVPKVPFQMVDSLKLTDADWGQLMSDGGFHFVRMNLNTAKRHNVFDNRQMVEIIAAKLADRDAILKSKVFPYQLLTAYLNATDIPHEVRDGLHFALEAATENVPELSVPPAVCIDTSGSMGWCVVGRHDTGFAGFRTSEGTKCVDVAGLIAATLVRKNPGTIVVPFDTQVRPVMVDPRDTIMTNARKLALNGGGTNCACALAHLNQKGATNPLVVFVSDNAAWVETYTGAYSNSRGTGMSQEWAKYKSRVPSAKLVNINLATEATTQVQDSNSVFNVGGFSDKVFTMIADWVNGYDAAHWAAVIEKIEL